MYSGLELGFFIQYWKKILNLESVPLLCCSQSHGSFCCLMEKQDFFRRESSLTAQQFGGSWPWVLISVPASLQQQQLLNDKEDENVQVGTWQWSESQGHPRRPHTSPGVAVFISGLPLCLWTGLCTIGLILVVPWDKGGNSLPQSMQRNPGTELCLSPEQGEDSQLTKQMLPSLPPV